MNIIYQGKQRRFVGASIGDTPAIEIWKGNKMIWPITDGIAHRIYVELPKRGTRDWQYWVHALDAVSTAAAPNNYMRFTVQGVDYYINSSFDGTEPYILDSNALTVQIDGVSADFLGATLDVNAVIKRREGTHEKFVTDKYEPLQHRDVDMPLLDGTCVGMSVSDHSKKRSLYANAGPITSLPSGKVYGQMVNIGKTNSEAQFETPKEWVKGVPGTDDSFGFDFQLSRAGYNLPPYQWTYPIYPAFTYTFKLPIISVEKYADQSSI